MPAGSTRLCLILAASAVAGAARGAVAMGGLDLRGPSDQAAPSEFDSAASSEQMAGHGPTLLAAEAVKRPPSGSSYGSSSYSAPAPPPAAPAPYKPSYHAPRAPATYTTPQSYGYKTKCYPYYESHPIDKCENYTEKICHTTQKEHCRDIPDKNCKVLVTSSQVRKCFNITETICSLKEDIKYEVIQVPYAIQKCHKVNERICDTVYETRVKAKEEMPCLKVENPQCVSKNYPVYDKICKSTVYFDCDTYYYGQGASIVPSKDYGSNDTSSGYGGYGQQAAPQQDNSYGGYEQTYCRKKPDTKCYQTPRTVSQQKCYHKPNKVCEKLKIRIPSVYPKQNCHTEYKKVCALEEHTEPKQVKKFVYKKECKRVPRQICESTDVKKLVPSCVKTTRKTCSYKPVQKCNTIPRKYCYKIYKKVRKDKCEPYYEPTTTTTTYRPPPSYESNYEAPKAPSYEEPKYEAPAEPAPSYKSGY